MKTSILVPIGEFRRPKVDDWFKDMDGYFIKACMDYQSDKYSIYQRHEIDVPEGEDWLYYRFNHGERWSSIRMPRPKIKKWIWYLSLQSPRGGWMNITTEKHLTLAELKEYPLPITSIQGQGWEAWRKLEGSEVEE
jgi:hypothetical protein